MIHGNEVLSCGKEFWIVDKTVRVGLIGYGYAGRTFHAPVLTCVPNMYLAKVVERRGTSSKERYPWVDVVRDAQELFQDMSIDLVIVATPSTNHYEVTKQALLSGKHVIVEKPFTVTVAEADELIALARERQLVLSVFHNRRWDGDFMTVREVVRQQLLGKLVECEFRWDRYRPVVNPAGWREWNAPGTGVLYDLGVHFLDQALNLFGIPSTIEAEVRIQREGGLTDDYFDVTLRYEQGLKIILKSSKLVREPGPRYVLHGTRGSFIKYGTDPQEAALASGLTPASPHWGEEPEECWGTFHATIQGLDYVGRIRTLPGSYTSYFQNVYDCIVHQADLAVKPEEARNAIRLIELALQSSREQRPVQVTL